jgi:protein O-mannosyl-transferase
MQYNDGVDRLIVRTWLSCTVATALTVATYAGVWYGHFQFDDFHSILENPHLERWETFVGHLEHMVRPFLYATFFVDRSLYGTSPTGYHVLNLLLHLGSGLLLYRILVRAVGEELREVPFWTALLFLIHPITTETVTYISGRASGLMAFFYLLALFLYIKASERSDRLRRLYGSGAAVSFLLSMGCKETAATFPFALLLWDGLFRRKRGVAGRAAVASDHLPFWIVLVFAAAWAMGHPRYTVLAQFSFDLRPFWDNMLSELHAGMYSSWLLVVPWQQSFDHDLPVLRASSEWPVPVDLLLFAGMTAGMWLAIRRLPLVSFGLAWYWLQLSPMMFVPRTDLLSERNLYLASIGLFLAVVVLGTYLIHRLMRALSHPKLVRVAAGSLVVMLLLVLCLATGQRNTLYRDSLLLWSDAVNKAPQKARPHNNLGHIYAQHGDWEEAILHFRMAAQLDPEYWVAQDNLRDAYLHHVGRR